MKTGLCHTCLSAVLVAALFGMAACGGCEGEPPAPADIEPGEPIKLDLGKTDFRPGETILLRFEKSLTAPPGNKYWIAVVPAAAPDDRKGNDQDVPSGAHEVSVVLPITRGSWELRLHEPRPDKPHGVVARAPFEIK